MDKPLLAGRTVTGPESARLTVDGRQLVNFVGCNYLALQQLPQLKAAALRALELGQPWSFMGSAGYGGSDPPFDDVASAASMFFGTETSVYLPTGYFCGLAAAAGMHDAFDAVFVDELAHFNLHDAARLSRKPVTVFRHADAGALREALRGHAGRPLVLSDGVFATTGRVPPLREYAALAAERGGLLFVDESHGYGVVGATGRGAAEHCDAPAALHGGTLSKAFCAFGGLLPCSRDFAARVRSLPPVRGANPGSAVMAMVGAAALRAVADDPGRRSRLGGLSQRLKTGLRGLGLEVIDTPAPITSFQLRSRREMLSLQSRLFDQGIHVLLSNYIGAGPQGTIRCATFADHCEADVEFLLDALRRLI
jgi:7-keto-8-aminopelargonate synthetase-like enzyme